MADSKRVYTPAFKAETVQMVQTSGKPAAQIAREIGVSDKTLYGWVAHQKQAQACGTTVDAMKGTQVELVKLKRENQRLRQERDFLLEAGAFFRLARP